MTSLPKDTPEQSAVVNYKGGKLVVIAFAGTGKTTTLIKYALANPTLRILYIAYNRAIRDEASEKFPANVECKTSHQLAYASFGKLYKDKLTPNLRIKDVAGVVESRDLEYLSLVSQALHAFMADCTEHVMPQHVPMHDHKSSLTPEKKALFGAVVADANRVWSQMVDRESPVPMTHDGYLKLFQLSRPNLARRYGAILLDEAQDSTPVVTDIVLSQPVATILVGDPHQQIYRWRGADNALSSPDMQDADHLYLTNSFRFGPEVARVANAILEYKGETRKVVGRGKPGQVLFKLPEGLPHKTVLARTVMGVISAAIGATKQGKRVFWVGGIDSYQLGNLNMAYLLREGRRGEIKDQAFLTQYPDWSSYVSAARSSGDPELRRAVQLLKNHADLPARLAQLKKMTVEKESEADVTVCTAHRSKGLEWPNVELYSDFPDVFELENEPDLQCDELNLLYVAVTRALERLALNATVESIIRHIVLNRQMRAQLTATTA